MNNDGTAEKLVLRFAHMLPDSPEARHSVIEIIKEFLMKPLGSMPPGIPERRHLPSERRSITHKFKVESHKGYITVGLFEDGSPGELFIKMSKQGSTMSGMSDSFATMTSLALQWGVPIKQLCKKFIGVRFVPQGHTGNPDIPDATSLTDYIFRWLALKFLTEEERTEIGIKAPE